MELLPHVRVSAQGARQEASAMRTEEEIKKQIKKGEEFIKKWPRSAFGHDNERGYRVFLKIVGKFRKGESLREIEGFAKDAYEGDDLMLALDTVEWLRGDEDIW